MRHLTSEELPESLRAFEHAHPEHIYAAGEWINWCVTNDVASTAARPRDLTTYLDSDRAQLDDVTAVHAWWHWHWAKAVPRHVRAADPSRMPRRKQNTKMLTEVQTLKLLAHASKTSPGTPGTVALFLLATDVHCRIADIPWLDESDISPAEHGMRLRLRTGHIMDLPGRVCNELTQHLAAAPKGRPMMTVDFEIRVPLLRTRTGRRVDTAALSQELRQLTAGAARLHSQAHLTQSIPALSPHRWA